MRRQSDPTVKMGARCTAATQSTLVTLSQLTEEKRILLKRFLHDGSLINPSLTADHLKMEDEDIIDVIAWAKFTVTGATQSTLVTLSELTQGKRIFLKVQGQKDCYLIGRKTPLSELMLDYTQRIGAAYGSLRFLYDGSRIHSKETADDLQMKDEDIITWAKRSLRVATPSTVISLPRMYNEKPIVLGMWDSSKDDHQLFYWIGRHTPLHNLMLDYCDRNGAFYDNVRFNYFGKSIKPNETTDDLEIEDGDCIDVYHAYFGCVRCPFSYFA
ncbi:Uncharacterized protein TCM_045231 [Theobroma cacao]|uniref:Rad60/SUMO-like domain-containing protein n=1 Tax=Theobroma cacao TaxID=3641 RepID=A0A061FYH5_THECC|nr:Uncharacterized protein TCM_045231 [Theobroma cacao]